MACVCLFLEGKVNDRQLLSAQAITSRVSICAFTLLHTLPHPHTLYAEAQGRGGVEGV